MWGYGMAQLGSSDMQGWDDRGSRLFVPRFQRGAGGFLLPETSADFGAMGYYAGELAKHRNPAFLGLEGP